MRFHKGSDGWGRDSYAIPQYAVAGASDCGTWSDSPAPSDRVKEELGRLVSYLGEQGINARLARPTQSGNVFMVKRWVVVYSSKFQQAKKLAEKWLEDHRGDTRYAHTAD